MKGLHILKGKGKCGVLHAAALGSFQHGKGSPREGRKPTPIRLHRHAAISVPAKLNFFDRVIKAAQKNLLTHTLSAKAEPSVCLDIQAKVSIKCFTSDFHSYYLKIIIKSHTNFLGGKWRINSSNLYESVFSQMLVTQTLGISCGTLEQSVPQ